MVLGRQNHRAEAGVARGARPLPARPAPAGANERGILVAVAPLAIAERVHAEVEKHRQLVALPLELRRRGARAIVGQRPGLLACTHARGDGRCRRDPHERAARQPSAASARVGHLMYFQFLCFPSAIHSMAWARRLLRVSSVFASVSHSRYSRLWLGGNDS